MPDRSETAARGSETRGLIAILILISAASAPAAATCACSSGGGASYNFLGDPAMNIKMGGYEEFARDDVPMMSSIAIPNVKTAALSRLSLNLRERRNIYLILSKTQGNISGEGSMTGVNGTQTADAVGTLQGDTLSLNVTTSGGKIYKFNLASEGSMVMGDFIETLPDGEQLRGLAEGRWRPEAI